MEVQHFHSPPYKNNVYLLWEPMSREAAVIDPSMASESVLFYIKSRPIHIKYILDTHGHFDHVWENAQMKKATDAKLCLGKEDAELLSQVEQFTPAYLRAPIEKVMPDEFLKEGDSIRLGNEELRVMHTPGHTEGSLCFYHEKQNLLFSGDTLFATTYGRTDLPHSDPKKMEKSLGRLVGLPPETQVLPGHGPMTVLGKESWLKRYVKK